MKLLSICDTFRNSPLSDNINQKHIIYSIAWHPFENKIALCGSLGYLMIYDALKSKLLCAEMYDNGTSSVKLDWNQLEP